MNNKRVKWLGSNVCDICGEPQLVYIIDGRTKAGFWATMCPACHKEHGVGLGIGFGQKYKSIKEDGKDFHRVVR